MYKKVLCLIMGRAGSNAIPQWIKSQYPDSCNVRYLSSDAPTLLYLTGSFFTDSADEYCVFRQECIRLDRVKEIMQDLGVKSLTDRIIVYSARDPWNHFASLLKFWSNPNHPLANHKTEQKTQLQKYIKNYKRILRQALGESDHLPPDSVFINYNEWFLSQQYRCKIADLLRLPTSENNINVVWKRSGFEDVSSASELDVLNRWKHYANNSEYLKLFDDEELVMLSKKLFIPPF